MLMLAEYSIYIAEEGARIVILQLFSNTSSPLCCQLNHHSILSLIQTSLSATMHFIRAITLSCVISVGLAIPLGKMRDIGDLSFLMLTFLSLQGAGELNMKEVKRNAVPQSYEGGWQGVKRSAVPQSYEGGWQGV
jgi:hypothetical protein